MSDVLSTGNKRNSGLHIVNLKPSVLKDTVELFFSFNFGYIFAVERGDFLKTSNLIVQIKKVCAELLILI